MIKPRISRRRAPRLPIHLEGSLSGRVPRIVLRAQDAHQVCFPTDAPRYLAGLEFLSLPAREATRLRRFLDEERRRRRSADGPSH